jgi:hypothetical protein
MRTIVERNPTMAKDAPEPPIRYPALPPKRLSGEEALTSDGRPTTLRVQDFWRWSASMLTDNTLRGTLAEFLVASALGQSEDVRLEWDAFDLVTGDGTKVEVKSASRWQSWGQSRPSPVGFGISPTYAWDATTGGFSDERHRQSDVYVFALLDSPSKAELNPLKLGQWRFFVLTADVLNTRCGTQKRVSLSRLRELGAAECDYEGLAASIRHAHECKRDN